MRLITGIRNVSTKYSPINLYSYYMNQQNSQKYEKCKKYEKYSPLFSKNELKSIAKSNKIMNQRIK